MTGTNTEARLARLRGRALPVRHNARTIAALASNPGCARRAVLDAAGADKQRLAAYAGFPAPFGSSRFAITRGNAFEAQVKASGAAELLRLLREHLSLPVPRRPVKAPARTQGSDCAHPGCRDWFLESRAGIEWRTRTRSSTGGQPDGPGPRTQPAHRRAR